ncbi:ribbon-helix-helix domain-containing protein [Spirulina sp. 06S082]|uniref:ribbon-helix-helix domain-containing protein n=1 Tax=Spirulina sp. 06S082 TaxID=3110248 RepID=UPI002B1FB4D5|nr:hypothetical protein [Spirulina sp. 06S082]MEA5470810.1 hypothetical protein [Spirulina sp. 06S082]
MKISLKPEQQALIQEKLDRQQYTTADEIISEALQLLEERDRDRERWLADVREKVAEGKAELKRGEGLNGEEVFAELLAELD